MLSSLKSIQLCENPELTRQAVFNVFCCYDELYT